MPLPGAKCMQQNIILAHIAKNSDVVCLFVVVVVVWGEELSRPSPPLDERIGLHGQMVLGYYINCRY